MDTIFVVTAVVFNMIALGFNSAVAGEASLSNSFSTNDLILMVFVIMSILVNSIAIIALNAGKQNREKLLNGIIEMYKENDVVKYYDPSLMKGYAKRYMLIIGVILCLALTSVIVPLIVRVA